jgi:RND family efflux transporter MFP subunit
MKIDKTKKMSKNILLIYSILLFISCKNENPGQANSSTNKSSTDTVKAFILKMAKLDKQTTLPGELLPYEKVEIHPKVPGYIKEIKIDIGSMVRKGQVLALIYAPEVESRLGESSGKMEAAKAKYEASRNTYDRVLTASKSDGVIAPDELQRAKNQMLADSADLVAAAYSSKSSRQIGNYLIIEAPFNGIITERNVHDGAYVGTANEKAPFVIEDNSKLRLRVPVPEALTGVKLKDNKIQFSTKANPDQLFEAKLVRKSGSLDLATRSETWEFEIKNEKEILKPGSFADVKMDISRDKPTFVVPFPAVVTTLERKFIIRVNNDRSNWVDISQGLNLGDKTEVFGPLHEGDTIVSKGTEELKSGSKVIVRLGK